MKYHPDRIHDNASPDGGEDAKKRATAKFAEISAAYELLSAGEASSGAASHPSFATTAAAAPGTTAYPERFNHPMGGMGPFSTGYDPFGFGTSFGNFSDPFELFRRTFGDIGAFNEHSMMGAFPPFTDGPSSAAMYAPTFGGFSMMNSSMMNSGFPANSTSSSYSSSTYHVGGDGSGASLRHGQSRMVSTTTTVINGRAVTRREETVVNPDGTTTTTVSSSGDPECDHQRRRFCNQRTIKAGNVHGRIQNGSTDTFQPTRSVDSIGDTEDDRQRRNFCNRPTIKAGNVHGQIQNGPTDTSQPTCSVSTKAAQTITKPHPRGYKFETKQHLQQNQSRSDPPATHLAMPSDETYIVDLTRDDVVDLTNENVSDDNVDQLSKSSNAGVSSTKKASKPIEEKIDPGNAARQKATPVTLNSPSVALNSPQPTSRKRKFCEVMSRCFLCCFPIPRKRRRINAFTDVADI
ncbi:hypothetical protein ACHAXR_010352 [Thalassiosira sp. AJA248-18]